MVELQIFIGANPAGLLKDFLCRHQVINLKFLRTEELEKYWKPSSSEGFAVCLISCHLAQKGEWQEVLHLLFL